MPFAQYTGCFGLQPRCWVACDTWQLLHRGRFHKRRPKLGPMDDNLHSPQRRLIELRIEHADLDSLIDLRDLSLPVDDLTLRRLKKRRLALRDQITTLERFVDPPEPA